MANAMLDWVETTKNEFRRRTPFAAVTTVGDINAANLSSTDTDREASKDQPELNEDDAFVIERLEDM